MATANYLLDVVSVEAMGWELGRAAIVVVAGASNLLRGLRVLA